MSNRLKTGYKMSHPDPGDEIVISGLSGYFPESNSVIELKDNLFNKVDLVTDDDRRWSVFLTDIPRGLGKIDKLDKFDASFFGIDYKLGHNVDPMSRLLLERTYEAIIDAGMNPTEFRNTKTGVFVGCCFYESELNLRYNRINCNEHGVIGSAHSALAVRIAQWLGVTGPAYTVDTACSSSLYALEHAFKAIRSGACDSAIVCGSNLCLHPYVSVQFYRMGLLSPQGRCKSFDSSANGYARSEAVVVCLLQKNKDARRAYAQVVYAKMNCDGYKDNGITYPAGDLQKCLLKDFYEECDIPAKNVEYIEAHGTGTAVGDPEELNAIDDVLCKNREDPLFIGSIKSNLGHTEAASGLCATVKICIAYHTGFLPPNIHFHEARTGIPALAEGRLKVVTEKQAWNRGLACFSGFGFGGANAHALLKNFDKEKVNSGVPMDNLPRLVCVSGRTKSAVQRILTFLESKPVDAEEVRLWHAIHENKIEGHKFRGYSLLKSTLSSSEVLASDVAVFRDLSRPVYLVYPGVGLKSVVAKELMEIPTFAAAIHRCHIALKVHNVNLIDMITDPPSKDNVDIIISTVALQIGLTDIIKSVGIRPDGYVGYGIGELACGYADGSLKEDEAILIAYNYGLHTEMKRFRLNESVKVAHRAEDLFSTVNSGHDVNKGNEINEETDVGTKLLKSMISELKPRLKLWLPRIGIKEIDKDSSVTAEYLYECLSHPLLSRDVIQIIPTNAISIQMTPGVDIQNILKKILKDGVQISLLKENTVNAQQDTLEALGRLFEAGLNLRVAELYPIVQFPVSQGTPMLSHLVEWDHREVWHTDSFKRSLKKLTTTERVVTISMADPDLEYLSGHVLGGRIIYPGTGYLVLVWETLAMMHKREYRQFSVVFENVRYHRATTIPKEGEIHFNIVIHPISGEFEVTEKNTTVVTGLIFPNTNVSKTMDKYSTLDNSDNPMELRLSHNDFYKDIKLRGYGHNGMFKGVLDCNISATHCRVAWVNNWIVYMDYVLQIFLLEKDTRNLYVPTEYPKISIDTELHYNVLAETNIDANQAYLDVFFDKHTRVVRSGGVEIREFEATRVSKKADLNTPIFNIYDFVPNFGRDPMSFEDVIRCNVDIIIENMQVHKFKVLEILDEDSKIINNRSILAEVEKNVKDLPQVWPDLNVNYYNRMDIKDVFKEMSLHVTEINKIPEDKSVVLLVGANLSQKAEILREYVSSLRDGGFILSQEDDKSKIMNLAEKYDLITMYDTDFECIVLFKKKEKSEKKAFIRIESLDQQFSWIQKLKKSIEHDIKIVLYAHNEISGILGLVNCLRREPKGDMIQCVLITGTSNESFDPEITFYKEQLDKNLAFNVFKNGCWGTYRHLNMKQRNIVSPMPHAFVNIETIGDLSTLKWFEGPFKTKDVKRHDDDSVFVHVYCAAVNFRDVMTAIGRVSVDAIARGRLEQEYVQGTEFAGRLSNGMRVIGMAPLSTANVVVCNKYRMMCVPDEWTLDEAATVLLAYSTVYLAFDVLGKMKPGESILIHAGTGGVGQAAINLALRRGCDVFTTVGTSEKRQYLKKLFPQLKESHIGNSRDTSFEQMVLTQTQGKGVDLVLNSLADDKLLASIRCLGRRGRLLEIGKYDILMNTQIEMCCHEKEISFHGVMLDYVFDEIPLAKRLIKLVTQGVAKGEVQPLSHCTFGKHEVETAYRYMASGKHIGKVIIKIRDEEKNVFAKPNALLIDAHRRYMCLPDSVYVLVGGLGGFGLELADWLVMRGAKKIVIVSSKGVSTGYQERKTRILTTYGVDVRIISDDVTTESGCKRVLEGAEAIGPVRAIFNLAGVLNDALFPQQTPEMFKRTFGPKALATLNLDKLSRHICPGVQDFVVFSSLACGRGNAGQSNYGMANSVMERICEHRKRDGLPAVAIQWGAIGDVGMVAEMQAEYGEAEVGGTMPQRVSSCLQALDTLLFQPKPVVSSYVLAQKKDKANAKKTAVETIAQIIGIRNLKAVSYQASLADLGMDSMMALEIKQTLERDFEIVLSAQELRTLTFAKLITLAPGQEVVGQTKSEIKDDYTFDFRYFIRNFGEEENAFKPYIMMPSKHSLEADINKATPRSRTLFMIPGLEGTSAFLEPLCWQINFNTCVLQLPLDKDTCTLEDMVQKLYKVVKPMLTIGSGFNILGYSYGTLPVLELAAKLESDGHTGTVFCIDGSPAWIKALFKTRFGINDDVKLQDSVTKYVIESTLTNKDSVTNFVKKSASIANYDDRIDYIISNSPETLKYSNDFIKNVCKVCMVRLKIVRDYNKEVVKKIKSRIVLIRPEVGIIRNFSQSYELDSFNENDVNVYYLKGNHWNILEDASCASIIEKHLSV